jgi:hypothetical protein
MGITWEVQEGGANAPPIFFLPKNRFLVTKFEEQMKNRNIL